MTTQYLALAAAVSLSLCAGAAHAKDFIPASDIPAQIDQDRFDMAMRIPARIGEDSLILPAMPRAERYDAIICNTSGRPGAFMTDLRYRPGGPVGSYRIGASSCVPLYGISALQANTSTGGDWTGVVFLRRHEP